MGQSPIELCSWRICDDTSGGTGSNVPPPKPAEGRDGLVLMPACLAAHLELTLALGLDASPSVHSRWCVSAVQIGKTSEWRFQRRHSDTPVGQSPANYSLSCFTRTPAGQRPSDLAHHGEWFPDNLVSRDNASDSSHLDALSPGSAHLVLVLAFLNLCGKCCTTMGSGASGTFCRSSSSAPWKVEAPPATVGCALGSFCPRGIVVERRCVKTCGLGTSLTQTPQKVQTR